jgi:methylmalonyl-CoA/ethylmalonyl-CoA epimerase
MTGSTVDGVALDHIAHAVPRWQDAWHRYAVDLGAVWSSGGPGVGFAPGQVQFANGGRIEMLMPYDIETNDFLARFLTRHGPGPHHLTFKVPDLDAALEALVDGGYEPIGIDRSDPQWMEAFVHPNQATGVVVQVAQAGSSWTSPPPDDFPKERRLRKDGSGPVPPASLTWVAHVVEDLGVGSALFVGVLGGQVVDEGIHTDHRWMEVTWGGPIGLRLLSPIGTTSGSPLRAWLGTRRGRIHHLEFTVEEPDTLPGARVSGAFGDFASSRARRDTSLEIPPEENAGLRLIVSHS